MAPEKSDSAKKRRSEVFHANRIELTDNNKVKGKPQIIYKFMDEKIHLNSQFGDVVRHHPHEHLIDQWRPTEPVKRHQSADSRGPAIIIKSQESFYRMIKHLNMQNTIAVDCEHHTYYSYFGMICLIQISTWKHDYILDTFLIRDEIRHQLKQVLEDEKILKVFHASVNDLRLLQIEWSIFVFPLIDTQLIYGWLYPGNSNIGFKEFVESTRVLPPHHIVDKKYQHADWRLRPLPDKYLEYAQADTRYLYRAWNVQKKQLFNSTNSYENIQDAIQSSKDLSKRIFAYPHYSLRRDYNKLGEKPTTKDYPLFENLWNFRDQLAQSQDVSPACILNRDVLQTITRRKPKTVRDLIHALPDTRCLKYVDCQFIVKIVSDFGNTLVTEPVMSDDDWEPQQPKLLITVPNITQPEDKTQDEQMEEEQSAITPAEVPMEQEVLIINAPNDDFTAITCYKCGEQGHVGRTCTSKRSRTAVKRYYQDNPDKKKRAAKRRRVNLKKNQMSRALHYKKK